MAELEENCEVEEIVNHRFRKGKIQYLIRWKNYGAKYDTWVESTPEGLKFGGCPGKISAYDKQAKIAEVKVEFEKLNDKIKRPKAEMEEMKAKTNCKICLVHDVDRVLTCGHLLCTYCYDKLTIRYRSVRRANCPFCQQKIIGFQQIFF